MIKLFLIIEVIAFAGAALVHFGIIIRGYEHPKAPIAETIIAFILFIGLVVTMINPTKTRIIALVVQGFALFSTLVGLFTIIIGVGPQSLLDISFHIFIIILLVCGLILARRSKG